MKLARIAAQSSLAFGVFAAATAAVFTLTTPAHAKPPCGASGPTVYCTSTGQYYINACWAARAGATGCEIVVFPPSADPT